MQIALNLLVPLDIGWERVSCFDVDDGSTWYQGRKM